MLYSDTDSFFFYFFVQDLTKKINAYFYYQDAFKFSVISSRNIFIVERNKAELYARLVRYFKCTTTRYPIVEFGGLRLKIYLFTVCDASKPIVGVKYLMDVQPKAATNGVTRS